MDGVEPQEEIDSTECDPTSSAEEQESLNVKHNPTITPESETSPYTSQTTADHHDDADIDDKRDNPVLHIFVIGFHHQKGSVVEFCHPPLPENDGSIVLPTAWKSLPFLALPDGSHNFDTGSVFFHLESRDPACKQTVFGVACHRQVDSKEFRKLDEEVTRSTVQKSVCVLLNQPLYGSVASKLEPVTHAYFNEMDFSKTEILIQFYEGLNHSILSSHFTDAIFHIGLCVRDLVTVHTEKILVLIKAMLLQKKIVVFANSAGTASLFILSLFSLFPGMLQKGLAYAAVTSESTEAEQPNLNISSPTDQFGFPLRLFDEGSLLHPYYSLQQMDSLKRPTVHGFVIGVANILYLQYAHCPADLIFNATDDEIIIRDTVLSQAVSLTTEDLRFIDFVTSTVSQWNDGDRHSHWEGSDDWVRFHFKAYLLCLASTASSDEPGKGVATFNSSFVESWKQTQNYSTWLNAERPGLADFPHGHPFAGDLTVSDVRLRLQHIGETILAYSGSGRKIGDAVRKTGEIVGTVYSSAKFTLSSLKDWMSGVVEDIDQEMTSSSTDNEQTVAVGSLEEGMTISAAARLGNEQSAS